MSDVVVTRQKLIQYARTFKGARYAKQGRSHIAGYDCGGFPIMVGRGLGITSFEFLGYANVPDGETYERLLEENLIRLPEIENATAPNIWDAKPADILAFDSGEGIEHMAIVSNWNGHRFAVLHAVGNYGVIEAPLTFKQIKDLKRAYQVPGVID